eukprot:CAMPEP_0114110564 /NCGR_PEP_ID=MMETSP0043_2-20121206/1376_1 /TAXON_ID=464988 /ORGANISM="Hemiselmis andersenii, Strain CCMP644" /LENGTH=32 /DNA_ID= /DNA_START= /DNA_END= /DNA_ORIENTATION=
MRCGAGTPVKRLEKNPAMAGAREANIAPRTIE